MGIDGLRVRQRRVVEAIVGAPLAWASRQSISRRAHVRSGPILEALAALAWVARWARDHDGKALRVDYWTLTPLGAERAGVMLDEEEEGFPRWFAAAVTTPLKSHERHIKWPERIPDPRPGPEYLANLITGEVTSDPNAAITICGIPVLIDPPRARHRGTKPLKGKPSGFKRN